MCLPIVFTCHLAALRIIFFFGQHHGLFALQAIVLKECDVYSYKSDLETDPFGMSPHSVCYTIRVWISWKRTTCIPDLCKAYCMAKWCRLLQLLTLLACWTGEDGNVWAFNFFFYNKKMKRIAYFSCRGISKSVAGNTAAEDSGLTYNSENDEDTVTRYGMANEMDLWMLSTAGVSGVSHKYTPGSCKVETLDCPVDKT